MKIVKTFNDLPFPISYIEVKSKKMPVILLVQYPSLELREIQVEFMIGTSNVNNEEYQDIMSEKYGRGYRGKHFYSTTPTIISFGEHDSSLLDTLEALLRGGTVIEVDSWEDIIKFFHNQFLEHYNLNEEVNLYEIRLNIDVI